jgi:hypothetical protein
MGGRLTVIVLIVKEDCVFAYTAWRCIQTGWILTEVIRCDAMARAAKAMISKYNGIIPTHQKLDCEKR